VSSSGVLVFTRTTAYRHDSIPDGVELVRRICSQTGTAVLHTEDPAIFESGDLARFDTVVWLSTSGEVLTPAGRTAFEQYIRDGGGFVGIHSATSTEYDWPFYRRLVGAAFASHPPVQPGIVEVVDPTHPSTAHLPAAWRWVDEWYDFQEPVTDVHILLTVDESSYEGGLTGNPHPLAWCHERFGGRAWYTALGHPREAYTDPHFAAHIAGGLAWVREGRSVNN